MAKVLDLTIAIPSYNEGKCLLSKVQSLLENDLLPSHIIIYDDGSTDDSISSFPLLILTNLHPQVSISIFSSELNLGIHRGLETLLAQVQHSSWFVISAVGDTISYNLLHYFHSFLCSSDSDRSVKILFGNTVEFWPESNIYSATRTISKKFCSFTYFTPQHSPIRYSLLSGILPASNSYIYHISIVEELSSILGQTSLYHSIDIVAYMYLVERYHSYGLFPEPVTITERISGSLGSRLINICDFKILSKTIYSCNLSLSSRIILHRFLIAQIASRAESLYSRFQRLLSLFWLYVDL